MKYYQKEKRYDPPLLTEQVQTERKTFFLDLKENDRGRFLKITEDVNGHRDTIIVPIDAVPDFVSALSRILDQEPAI